MKRTTLAIAVTLATLTAAAIAASIDFRGTLELHPNWTHVKTEGASAVIETLSRVINATHTTGTNANQMTSFVRLTSTLTNSAEVVHDLQGGVNNSFGDTITFARVNFLTVTADATNLDTITIGGATNDVFATWAGATNHTVTVRPGGAFMLHAPDVVGYVSTNGNLRVANDGTNTVGYALYIGGIQ